MELVGPPSERIIQKGPFDGIDGIDGIGGASPSPLSRELSQKGPFDGIDGIGGAALERIIQEKARLTELMELMAVRASVRFRTETWQVSKIDIS